MTPEQLFIAALEAQQRHRSRRAKGEARFRIAVSGWAGGKAYDLGHGLIGKPVKRSKQESLIEVTVAAALAALVVLGVIEQDGEHWKLVGSKPETTPAEPAADPSVSATVDGAPVDVVAVDRQQGVVSLAEAPLKDSTLLISAEASEYVKAMQCSRDALVAFAEQDKSDPDAAPEVIPP